ncbi:MAG: restriction endonuclease subunit S [Coriobacteriia bacterium]|nr:restriction endonuclease subunit S [Coriobacteriia bacterium]
MSRLEQLIAKLCPDGVEYKELGEVVVISNGKDYKHLSSGDIPVYGSGGIMRYVDEPIYSDESVLIPRKGSLSNIIYTNTPFWSVDTMFYTRIDKHQITPRFLYHVLLALRLYELNTAGGVPSLTKSMLDKVKIPVPPLPIQKEIIHILDNYTNLSTELDSASSTELEARVKQYEYYCDALLVFDPDIDGVSFSTLGRKPNTEYRWMNLGDVAVISGGRDHKKLADGDIPVYGTGGIMRYANQHIFNRASVLIPRKGSINNIYYVDSPFWIVDTLFYTQIDNSYVIPKYLYYLLKTQKLERLNIAGGVPSLTKAELVKYPILIPPLEEQERIVAIVDRLDTLVNSITSSLTAEIAARRKQYEYYRVKLLSFGN